MAVNLDGGSRGGAPLGPFLPLPAVLLISCMPVFSSSCKSLLYTAAGPSLLLMGLVGAPALLFTLIGTYTVVWLVILSVSFDRVVIFCTYLGR